MTASLDDDDRDLLQETCNVAMGLAGAALARFFADAFVKLSVPHVFLGPSGDVGKLLTSGAAFAEKDEVSTFRQRFMAQVGVPGEVIVCFGAGSGAEVARRLGHDETDVVESEVLAEIASLLTGVTIGGVLRQLFRRDPTFSRPSPVGKRNSYDATLDAIFSQRVLFPWDHVLALRIAFRLEDDPRLAPLMQDHPKRVGTFQSQVVAVLRTGNLPQVKEALGRLRVELLGPSNAPSQL
jgi:chemotaxis protein CheC